MKRNLSVFCNVIFCLFVVLISLQGCDEKSSELALNGDAPAGFNYLTVNSFDLQIAVNDEYEGKYLYKIEVFDLNPLSTDTVANLLAAGVANQHRDFSTRVVVPQCVKFLYIKQTDPQSRSTVKVIPVSEAAAIPLRCSFKPSINSPASIMQKAPPVITERATDYVLPDSYTTITENGITLNGGKYYIPKGVRIVDLDFGTTPGSEVYIHGGLSYSLYDRELDLPENSKIIVLEGGGCGFSTMKFPVRFDKPGIVLAIYPSSGVGIWGMNSVEFSNGAKFLADGDVDMDNLHFDASLVIGKSSLFVGNGNYDLKHLTIKDDGIVEVRKDDDRRAINFTFVYGNIEMSENATLINGGDIFSIFKLISHSPNVRVFNNHILRINTIDFSKGVEIDNHCAISCAMLKADGVTVINADGAGFKCHSLDLSNTKLNLSGGSMFGMFDCDDETNTTTDNRYDYVYFHKALFASDVTINGYPLNGVKPLFYCKDIVNQSSGSNILSLNGGLEFSIENGAFPPNRFFKEIQPDVLLTSKPLTRIAATDCNWGGINVDSNAGGDPASPGFPMEVVEGTDYVYSMEDVWPYMGDYDMNDFVFRIHGITKYVNAENKVEKMSFLLTPLAAGSTMKLTAALQLDGVVSGDAGLEATSVSARKEEGHVQANFVLFENVHSLFGLSDYSIVNTFPQVPKVHTTTHQFTITFSTPVEQDKVSVDKLNFYSIVGEVNSTDRHEIHLAGYAPSNRVRSDVAGYKDENNRVWALMLPTSAYKHPAENVKIDDAYPGFVDWVRSGGKENTDWYIRPASKAGLVFDK